MEDKGSLFLIHINFPTIYSVFYNVYDSYHVNGGYHEYSHESKKYRLDENA